MFSMLLSIIPFKLFNKSAFVFLMIMILLGIVSCDSPSKESQHTQLDNILDTIYIGRLICGGHLPLAIVEKKYQDQLKTFKLKTVQNHDWNDVITDMKSGKLAGTFILSPLAMNMIYEGFPGKIVLTADRNGNGFVLSDQIKSISDLKNRQSIIAVPHIYSQHHVLLHTLLKQFNVPKETVKVLGMPPRDMINSLRRGEIDGFIVGEPESNKSVSLGVGWLASISPQIWKDHMDHVFLASDYFINEQPEKLQELINQLVRGGEFIEHNPQEAAIMGEDYTGSSASVFEKVLTTPADWISYDNMIANNNDIITMADKLVEMKLWPTVPENISRDYFDMRFAIKAEQTLLNK